jgi:hypothetical protein
MKGAGRDGGDIGANVVFRTEGGALTKLPLWDARQGYRFVGCGAVVAGVNDASASACIGVHTALNVGAANGCAVPY